MKYCGVATPFRGVRLYAQSIMGISSSEMALEELTCCVLGDLLEEGVVAKLTDDLYSEGASIDKLLTNWKQLLDTPIQPLKSVSIQDCHWPIFHHDPWVGVASRH